MNKEQYIEYDKKINELIGNKIRNIRTVNGLSRRELAEQIACSHQQIAKYEQGQDKPSITRLNLIAQTFEVPVTHFLEEDTPQWNRQSFLQLCLGKELTKISDRETLEKLTKAITIITSCLTNK